MLCDAFYEHLTMSAGTIIDSGLSNIDSAARALEYCGAEVVITHDPEIVRDAGRLVLLGVGAFPVAMERLYAPDLSDAISYAIIRAEQPMLSICLGRQLWADIGHENETTLALDLIKGDVRRLEKASPPKNEFLIWPGIQSTIGADACSCKTWPPEVISTSSTDIISPPSMKPCRQR